jgi:Mrp family chromosome partitioning ATPase/uncharacterized protein involved in exopolysaccharide biosynthesis
MKATDALPLRPQWWVLLFGVLVGLAGGGALIALGPVAYSSSVSILVEPVPATGQPGLLAPINLDTEAVLARSSSTARTAATALGTSPDLVVDAITVDVVANSSVLVLHFEAGTPAAAQAGARAVAEAYLASRAEVTIKSLTDHLATLTKKLHESATQLATLDARIAGLTDTGGIDAAGQLDTLRATRATLTEQITTLTARVTDLSTTTVNAGRIVHDADLPTSPSRLSLPLTLAVCASVGLILGAAAAVLRERLHRRVRGGADVIRLGLPLLAEFDSDMPGLHTLAPRVFAPQHAPGRAFHRLRNEVVAALPGPDHVILVTGASPGRASTVVSANLAAALARADNEVILVGANVPEFGADGLLLSHVFDIADVPGLTDVLTRRSTIATALQNAPRAPRLRVITPGGTASAAGLLQSEAVRTTLRALRDQASYVVVEAPSAASGADAQSLASLADGAILAVEADRTRQAEIADAARQLQVIGTRLLGVVVLPPLAAAPDEHDDESEPPDHERRMVPPRGTDTWINPATMNAPTAIHPVVPTKSMPTSPTTPTAPSTPTAPPTPATPKGL